MGIREDRLGRAAKESAFDKPDLYRPAVEMEIFRRRERRNIAGKFRGKEGPHRVLDAIKA